MKQPVETEVIWEWNTMTEESKRCCRDCTIYEIFVNFLPRTYHVSEIKKICSMRNMVHQIIFLM